MQLFDLLWPLLLIMVLLAALGLLLVVIFQPSKLQPLKNWLVKRFLI